MHDEGGRSEEREEGEEEEEEGEEGTGETRNRRKDGYREGSWIQEMWPKRKMKNLSMKMETVEIKSWISSNHIYIHTGFI